MKFEFFKKEDKEPPKDGTEFIGILDMGDYGLSADNIYYDDTTNHLSPNGRWRSCFHEGFWYKEEKLIFWCLKTEFKRFRS